MGTGQPKCTDMNSLLVNVYVLTSRRQWLIHTTCNEDENIIRHLQCQPASSSQTPPYDERRKPREPASMAAIQALHCAHLQSALPIARDISEEVKRMGEARDTARPCSVTGQTDGVGPGVVVTRTVLFSPMPDGQSSL
ncbi:hypothetical protein EYF80_013464 [Liparis tanakae]|uniref:Uncharacterized protein n=1 Tax=Liparis tanakae TaxID=230148 RepID=A0A4Z2IFJ9_9TELE|nr:hypothetical protein EYF80_013464 [Liparis tanakae]